MAKKSKSGVDVGVEATPQAAQTGAQPRKQRKQGKAVDGVFAAPRAPRKPKSITESAGLKTGSKKKGWQEETQFKPGQSGNPAGRPKGSRNKFSENYIDAMQRAFEERGVAAIHAVIDENPAEFLRLCSAIIPKQFGIEEGTQDCFLKLWQAISDGTAGAAA